MAYSVSQGSYDSALDAKKKARERAEKLGHKLGMWRNLSDHYSKWHRRVLKVSNATCKCGMGVTVRSYLTGQALRLTGSAHQHPCNRTKSPALPEKP